MILDILHLFRISILRMVMNTLQIISRVIDSPDYVIQVSMPLHSKARPRMTRSGHTYMAQSYRDAQAEMRKQVKNQWEQGPLEGPLAVHIEMHGEGRGDLDNMTGFVLDAAGPSKGVPGILWVDDRASVISYLSAEWHKATKADSRWTIKILTV